MLPLLKITKPWLGKLFVDHSYDGRKHPAASGFTLSAYSLIWTCHQIWEILWLSNDNFVANQLIYLFMFQCANLKSRNIIFEFCRYVQNQCQDESCCSIPILCLRKSFFLVKYLYQESEDKAQILTYVVIYGSLRQLFTSCQLDIDILNQLKPNKTKY